MASPHRQSGLFAHAVAHKQESKIRVCFKNAVLKRIDRVAKKAHTRLTRLCSANPERPLNVWGPSQGEMSKKVFAAMNTASSVCLIGAGSAVNYLIDALVYLEAFGCAGASHFGVYFTTRDRLLFNWARNVFERAFLKRARIVVALTGLSREDTSTDVSPNGVVTVRGRIDFEREVRTGSVVFCQRGTVLKSTVRHVCLKRGAHFHGGLGGGAFGGETARELWRQAASAALADQKRTESKIERTRQQTLKNKKKSRRNRPQNKTENKADTPWP